MFYEMNLRMLNQFSLPGIITEDVSKRALQLLKFREHV
jgi:hypothetical protein